MTFWCLMYNFIRSDTVTIEPLGTHGELGHVQGSYMKYVLYIMLLANLLWTVDNYLSLFTDYLKLL